MSYASLMVGKKLIHFLVALRLEPQDPLFNRKKPDVVQRTEGRIITHWTAENPAVHRQPCITHFLSLTDTHLHTAPELPDFTPREKNASNFYRESARGDFPYTPNQT